MAKINSGDNIVSVHDVSKVFRLPHEKTSSIKGAIINFYKRNKTYEQQQALKGLSFEVKRGEFFGVVGRNGSGKSTLLKLLAGIYQPTGGSIQVKGLLTPFIELGVGFSPELTGRENVFLNGALLGFNHKEMEALYDDIVKFAELDRFMDQKLKNYSSGMQVRLAFSIAIKAQSDILLIDEVLAVGDAAFQRKCFDHFMFLKKNKQTVILVTHDMAAVRQYCDKAIMIDRGKIVERGNPERVAQAYQRLFSTDMSSVPEQSEKNGKRWGTGKLHSLKTTTRLSKDYLIITTRYRAESDLPSPIYGFTVYGPAGNNILEGNTLREGHKTPAMKKGDQIEIVWQVPNIFAAGRYEVSVACCDQSAVEYYDWLNGATKFMINKEGVTAGVVDPQLTIKAFSKVSG